jgi:hypothetical protein
MTIVMRNLRKKDVASCIPALLDFNDEGETEERRERYILV